MGVYTAQAIDYIEKNQTRLAPYDNPLMESGVLALRADMAMFEAMIEYDFADLMLQEADNAPTNNNQQAAAEPVSIDKAASLADYNKAGLKAANKKYNAQQKAADRAEAKENRNNKIRNLGSSIKNINWKEIWNRIKEFFIRAFNAIRDAILNFKNKISDFIKGETDGGNAKKYAQRLDGIQKRKAAGEYQNFTGSIKLVNKAELIKVIDGYYNQLSALNNNFKTNTSGDSKGNIDELIRDAKELDRNISNARSNLSSYVKTFNGPECASIEAIKLMRIGLTPLASATPGGNYPQINNLAKLLQDDVRFAQNKSNATGQSTEDASESSKVYQYSVILASAAQHLASAYIAVAYAEIQYSRAALNKLTGIARKQQKKAVKELKKAGKGEIPANSDENETPSYDEIVNGESGDLLESEVEEALGFILEDLSWIHVEEAFA